MLKHSLLTIFGFAVLFVMFGASEAKAQYPNAAQSSRAYNVEDWNRFYHYPYVYYPQNYWSADYYRSSGDIYNRYPAEMQVPAYHQHWQNYYPAPKRYHKGFHYIMDIF